MAKLLRQEARPLSWDDLDDAQRDALTTIVAMLDGAVEGIRKPARGLAADRGRRTRSDLKLDRTRSSRLVFLSGDRGTGKTTVFLSLQSLCQAALEDQPTGTIPDDTWKAIGRLSRHLVWLEPLDMENLPRTSNLMAAILARIDSACDELGLLLEPGNRRGEATMGRTSRGLLDPSPEYHQAILELQRLQTRVALAWEGNLAGRGGQLDPESYAVEVIRAEKARLALNQDFHEVLERLAEQVFDRRDETHNPLFVLPVDDVDLNPARCLDVLRILRSVSVPRLFAIVLGDVVMAGTAFNLVLAGELAAAGGPGPSLRVLPITMAEVRARVSELAANAVRKLIPVGQSIHLRGMTVSEALEFRPRDEVGADPSGTRPPRILAAVMQACPLQIDSPWSRPEKPAFVARNLLSFLITPGLSSPLIDDLLSSLMPKPGPGSPPIAAPRIDPKPVNDCPYQGKFLLGAAPRRVADLWQRLQEVALPEPTTNGADQPASSGEAATQARSARVQGVLGLYCRGLIAEDTTFTPAARQAALRALSENMDRTWEIDTRAFLVMPVVGPSLSEQIASVSLSTGELARQYVETHKAKGWKIWAQSQPGQVAATTARRGSTASPARRPQSQPGQVAATTALPPLEMATAAAVMLLQDLTALGTGSDSARRLHLIGPPWWALTQWRIDHARRTHLVWPAPRWASFWEYDLFLGLWDAATRSIPKKVEEKLEFLLYSWIDCSASVVERKAPVHLIAKSPDEKQWGALVKRLDALLKKGTDDTSVEAAIVWFRDLTTLVMPELIGHRPEVWAHFSKSRSFSDFWQREANEILRLRLDNLERMAASGLRALALQLGSLQLPEFLRPCQLDTDQLDSILPPEGRRAVPSASRTSNYTTELE
jgi:hypothetical protein